MARHMKKFILCFIFFNIIAGCNQGATIAHPNPSVIDDTDKCVDADQHLAQLCAVDSEKNSYCCATESPTKKGKTFTQFCIEKQNEGVWLNPTCLSTITSCDQIDVCTKSR